MLVSVWKTGHEIADTVAEALKAGLPSYHCYFKPVCTYKHFADSTDANIGYGILRGMDDVFRASDSYGKPWFNVDRGYFDPGHFEGYYRISHRGTQAVWGEDAPRIPFEGMLEPVLDGGKYVLICPPTPVVCKFFGVDFDVWREAAKQQCVECGFSYKWRYKGFNNSIIWDKVRALVTFNSSVGWEAVRRGIPCLSSVEHSSVGSYYREKSLDRLMGIFHTSDRKPLFDFMRGHQFTLSEIRAGKACSLIRHYIQSSSAMTAANPSPVMSRPIP